MKIAELPQYCCFGYVNLIGGTDRRQSIHNNNDVMLWHLNSMVCYLCTKRKRAMLVLLRFFILFKQPFIDVYGVVYKTAQTLWYRPIISECLYLNLINLYSPPGANETCCLVNWTYKILDSSSFLLFSKLPLLHFYTFSVTLSNVGYLKAWTRFFKQPKSPFSDRQI